ncbi:MAG: UvrD-helicase domain-containing protein [Holosporaceae bacterium]|nr:UvrD-helicase domain-containing protein [Holosporaceae bacterium]
MKEIRDVGASLWISASAGTGKTKSLVDRLLALLLNGVNPNKILCLTYTRTAASEMLDRLAQQLQDFRRMSERELLESLKKLGFDERHLPRAKSLYEKSLLPSGLVQIKTIHGFCSWILKKFPLETGIHPGMGVCDDYQKNQLLNTAVNKAFVTKDLQDALQLIADYIQDFPALMGNNIARLTEFTSKFSDFEQLYADFFGLERKYINLNEKEIIGHLLNECFSGRMAETFLELAEILSGGSAEDVEKSECLKAGAQKLSDDFLPAFFTKELKIRARKCSAALAKKHPSLVHRLEEAARRSEEFLAAKRKYMATKINAAFFIVAKKIIGEFNKLKKEHYCVDFNDLIWTTSTLLKDMEWVMYKIDGGLDHLLIDEAQDTSPEQWDIVETIANEFFSNYGSEKTVFVVGDEKQSIYSFQGADLEQFRRMRDFFQKSSEACGQKFYNLDLNVSYRSTGNILSFVDTVFRDIFPNTSHVPHRSPEGGVVEIVELFASDTDEDGDGEESVASAWEVMKSVVGVTADEKLAIHIANLIRNAIDEGVFVPSRGRSARPSDFLILFQHRDIETMRRILDALGNAGIPTSGIDRFRLKDELIVEDLITLAEFAVFPQDDLACALVLKSPAVGLNEDELRELCISRKESHLWDHIWITEALDRHHRHALEKLKGHLDNALRVSVYDFFMHLLTDGLREKFVARLGPSCLDALREFLEIVQDNDMPVQSFCDWFRSFDHETKRESSGVECVKLMTVHSAKGLQSPFVIIADSHFFREDDDKILQTPEGILLWDFSSRARTNEINMLWAQESCRHREESQRLLYVALTRAEDFLYILGKKRKKMHESCWYNILSRGRTAKSAK